MANTHKFGGSWTQEKLDRVGAYLEAYTTIFHANERAQYFTTYYVDAFAGTGHRQDSNASTGLQEIEDNDSQANEFLEGSVSIALNAKPGFDRFLFIERSPKRFRELDQLVRNHPKANRISVLQGDANERLLEWRRSIDWKKTRAVVFLDPYGMQVNWETIAELGATQGIDLWLLFPIGMAVMRLLTRKRLPPPEWEAALTRIFGDDEWKNRFYVQNPQISMFEDETENFVRDANWQKVADYLVERLKTVFPAVHRKPYPLFNSQKIPLYLLCFAASNEKGAPTALKIANHLLQH